MPELDPTEVAAILSRKAEGDAKVMRKLADDEEIADDAVGFHAQQAIEKWLKAVIASHGEDFEYTHDIRHLIVRARLKPGEANQPFDIRQAINLTEYAVPLRYEDLLDAEPLDRASTVALVEEVEQWAKSEIAASTPNRA
ncbi:MAG TPA: HEPN domain-containing protein [Solirubrobacterales bacterium]|nr:HEPN domain-containing protein [Solirubrobacterales bacterium]